MKKEGYKKNIIFFSRNDFPNGDAGSVRDYMFAKMYQDFGYNVHCICLSTLSSYGVFEGIQYKSIRIEKSGVVSKLKYEFGYKKRMKYVLKNIENNFGEIAYFHIVDIPINAIQFLKRYSKKNNIKLIHDSVEWYSSCNFKHGVFSYPYITKNILNRYIINKQFKVIAISKYLQDYYLKKDIHSERIPIIMDTHNMISNFEVNDKLEIIYAGSPGKKDYLKEIILGVSKLSEAQLRKLNFNIIGVEKTDLINNIGLEESELLKISKSIKIYGRIEREKVIKILSKMDFSILLRPSEEIYTKAGFPTKVVESLSCGVPMICNITSDLGAYLEDMKNSILVEECTSEALKDALEKALSCSKSVIDEMKHMAKQTAKDEFDYKRYYNKLTKIMN